ncbi:hypothetical protein OOJ91_21155 [Micromonospora lupini]|uniref:hypothetical protein n=1 Tax=Micromonospora lupini TaxID=285679 RepID=UPI00225A385C|nr:hypothetical protein [Micromonospora lupini]MCX5068353.1 hypothetical protein [Micromonospora lupini]
MAFTLTLKPEVEQRLKELAEAEQRSMHKTVEVAMRIYLVRSGVTLNMPAKERMALTDALVSGEVDSVDELALRLSPYLEMAG